MVDRDRDFGDEDQLNLEDPLGLAQQRVPKDEHIRASSDEASVRRRRKRARLGPDADDRTTDGLGDLDRDPLGATGIDMGGGGQGTDIKSK